MILVVGTEAALREQVVRSLADTQWVTVVGAANSVGEAQEILRGASPPRVVVVGRSFGVEGAGQVASAAAALRNPPLVLLVGEPTADVLRAAMRAGIRDVLPIDFGAEDILGSLREAGVTDGGPVPLDGLTVAVFSTKGGVGTSVLASNLAVLLGDRVDGGTTLIDLDLASADQSIMHGLAPRWTIQDLADGAVGFDVESLRQVVAPIEGSNSRLLPGPVDPALAETIAASDVSAVIAAVRAESRVAVLDTAAAFDERTLAALDASDVIVLVSSLDVAALRSLTVSLQTIERLGIDHAKVLVALVRIDSKSGLMVADVERAIERRIDVGVPSTRTVPRSVNEGVPLAVSSPRNAVVSALDELVDLLVARMPAQAVSDSSTSSRGIFPWSRSKRTSGGDEADNDDAGPPGGVAAAPAEQPEDIAPAVESEATDAEAEDTDNVRPLRSRDAAEPDDEDRLTRPVRRRVSRRRPTSGDDPSAAEGDDDGVDAADPPVRAVPPLDAMPPPNVVADDDDDEPRRRRRR